MLLERAGPFEIVGRLGEGATGVVYEARRIDRPDDPPVALKVLHRELLSDPQIRRRFSREAAILRRLDGQHLCPILEFGEVVDDASGEVTILYMALPKLEGTSLAKLMAKEPLAVDRAVRLFAQICAALDEAHRHDVIHRDLKPHNVIVGPDDHVTVVDFGMAKIVTGSGTGTTALTQHNMVFGTPEYMAPEQARGDELDRRCDIYAAGVILYEMLTGRVPFSGPSPLVILTAVMTEVPKAPRERAPDRAISPALEAVVTCAMARDPAQRYDTAGALSSALAHAASFPEDVASIRPASPAHTMTPADGHSITLVGAPPRPGSPASTPPVSRTSSPSRTSGKPPSSRSSAPAPDKPSARARATWIALWVLAALMGVGIGVYLSLTMK